MTIFETQELVEAWTKKKSTLRYHNELTNMAALTEEVGELARVIAEKHGNPSADMVQVKAAMGNELSDVMWALFSLANQAGIDMTQAFIDNLEKRNTQGK